MSRDPLQEQTGPALYVFVGNDAIGLVDLMGLVKYSPGGPGFPGPIHDYDPWPRTGGPAKIIQLPTPIDHINPAVGGRKDGDMVDNTWWFEERWPEELEGIIETSEFQLGLRLWRLCDEKINTVDGFNPYGRSPYFFPQSWPRANFQLGRVLVKVENISVQWRQLNDSHKAGCLHYNATADLIIYDGLGFNPGDNAYDYWPPSRIFYPGGRTIERARWKLKSSGDCCECEE